MIINALKKASLRYHSRLSSIKGVPCALLELKNAPTSSMLLCFRDGVAYEDEDEWGISHFIEHILFRGNKAYPSLYQISHRAESLGGRISAFSTRDGVYFWMKAPPGMEKEMTDLLGNLLTTPELRDEFIEKERQIIIQERQREINNPSLFTSLLLEETLLSPRPICRHPIGSTQVIDALDSASLKNRLDKVYHRDNLMVCVAGSISEDITKHIEELIGKFPGGSPPRQAEFEVLPDYSSHRYFLRESPHKSQVFLSLGWPITLDDDREIYPLRVLNSLLGAGYTSSFNRVLREEKNLTYLCTTGLNLYGNHGVYKVNMALADSNLKPALELVHEIIEDTGEGKITGEQMDLARIKHASHLIFKMEDSLEASRILSQRLMREGNLFCLQDYIKTITEVTAEDVSGICRKKLPHDKCRVVIQTGSSKIQNHESMGIALPVRTI